LTYLTRYNLQITATSLS